MLLPTLLALGGTLAAAESVFWIVQLDPLATTRLDPVVSPGQVSAHVHSFVGASNLAPELSFPNLQQSSCTTATVGADKSNYWVPQLYRKSGNGTLTLMPLSYVNVYYQLRRQPQEPVYEFPPGFRMVSGNPARSTFDASDNRQTAINYNCLNFAGGGGPETNGFPDRSCPNDLRAQVRFPSCWDGVHAWLPGGAHMSFGAGAADQGGKCPDSHPYRTMSLFYEFHFKDNFAYEAGARVWATGDTTGYSFHGDFFNGWPEGLFTDIWAQGNGCDVFFSPQNCPPLAPTWQPNRKCSYSGITVDEDIGRGGGLSKLPGNNPLYGSGGPNRPAGYAETSQMKDAGGATVAGRDVYNGPIKATVRRRGIVRGDPGTIAVEQLDGGETPVAAPSASSAAASAASSAAASAASSAAASSAAAVPASSAASPAASPSAPSSAAAPPASSASSTAAASSISAAPVANVPSANAEEIITQTSAGDTTREIAASTTNAEAPIKTTLGGHSHKGHRYCRWRAHEREYLEEW